MFGTYRSLLAIMVVLLHLGGLKLIGAYAVFGFYILSGYLMTLIMLESYGHTAGGMFRYALNRFLRIYPVYWASCLLSLALIYAFSEVSVSGFKNSMYYPHDLASTLRNLFIVFPAREQPRLVPPSWALTVELFFYVCIGLGLARSRLITIVWFVVSIGYTLVALALGFGWEYRYFFIPAASLPFSLGALIYHYREVTTEWIERRFPHDHLPTILFGCVLLNWAIGDLLHSLRGVSFYINLLLCAATQISLLNRSSLPLISKRMDEALGEFSYPVYLLHYQIGFLVFASLHWAGVSIESKDIRLALVSLPWIFLAAWLMTRFVERPIESLRVRIKKGDL